MQSMRTGGIIAAAAVLILVGLVVRPTTGFERYSSPDGGWCAGCHGDFDGGSSPRGTVFPYGSNHLMHRASDTMNTACDMCHSKGDDLNPFISFSDSDGFGGGPGVGCNGCHGRDYGERGVLGVGLREVHRGSGVSSCGASSCHRDDPDPLPESVPPPYYGSYDTRAWDSCNFAPFFGENFSLDPDNHRGLDNDGDGLYDEDDSDCDALCEGDVNEDLYVDFGDVLLVLSQWGPCNGCPGDLNDDGFVDFGDILVILGNWGPCF